MKIGLATVECKNGNIDFNLKQILLYLQKAASRKIDFLFFGESFLQGFDSLVWNFEEDKEKAVSKKSAVIELIKNEAYILDIGVGFGYFELYNESIYSSYLVISNKGNEIVNYRRMSMGWRESNFADQQYQEGSEICIFSIDNYDFTIALCGDLWDEKTCGLFLNEKVSHSTIIWPVYVDYSLQEWVRELKNYQERALLFSDNVCLVNNITKTRSVGGAFYFNKFDNQMLDFDIEDILLVEI